MQLIIYLGLQAFAEEPQKLLPTVENLLACEKLASLRPVEALEQKKVISLPVMNDEDSAWLSTWFKNDVERKAIIAWPQPDVWLGASLARGATAEEALGEWLAQALRLLAIFRSARRQVILVGYIPDGKLKVVKAPISTQCGASSEAIYQLAASYVCEQSKDLKDTHAYLAASSHECADFQQSPTTLIQNALKMYMVLQNQKMDVEQANEKITAVQEENILLLEQLHSIQESLEKRSAAQRQIQKKNEEREYEIVGQKKQLEEENLQIIQHLHSVQEAYETLYTKHQVLVHQLSSISLKNKQDLEENNLLQLNLRHELEKRQKEINVLRSGSQQHILHLERLVKWLRVHAQRHSSAAYNEIRSYKMMLPKQIALIEASPFFDADWYCEKYPDVAQSGINPAEHFIKFGAIEGRHSGPLFNTVFYVTHYGDVAASGQHPLLHYLRHGMEEQRETRPARHQLSEGKTSAKGAEA